MKNERTFYNTNQTTGPELIGARSDAKNQQDEILKVFRRNAKTPMSPSEIHNYLYSGTITPLTSVRRAISNLTEAGKLKKLDSTKIGIFGRREHCWEYVQAVYVQKGLF